MTSIMMQGRGMSMSLLSTATVPLGGKETQELVRRAVGLRTQPSPGSLLSRMSAPATLEEQLFDALATVKILTAQVSMHLDREWRKKLFRQLDSLHDPDEWEAGDLPVRRDSFATFLKAILSINPERRPGLGLSDAGNLVASWTTGKDRLTIQFLPLDRLTWVLSRYDEYGQVERYAGDVDVSRLASSLSTYYPDHWFKNDESYIAS